MIVKFVASILLALLYKCYSSELAQHLRRGYNLRLVIIKVGNRGVCRGPSCK